MEIFFDDFTGYPTQAVDGCTAANADATLSDVGLDGVSDPLDDTTYFYAYDSNGSNVADTDDATDYVFVVQLEADEHTALKADVDGSIDFAVAGVGACDCGTNDDQPGNTPFYCVQP